MAKKVTAQVIPEGQLAVEAFKGKKVRKVLHDNEWYFSIVDVMEAVAETASPSRYWNELKAKLVNEEGFDELFGNIEKLKMTSADGKERLTDAANTETMFRIVQSIPSKKAEPFKRWLAKVGYERILEAQNPDIAIKRAILDYKSLGRDGEWIEQRVRCLLARQDLTGVWSQRGVQGQEYAVLTNLIQERTFGFGVQNHKAYKSLKKSHNLRDHMTGTELALTTLAETFTKDIAVATDAQGYFPNRKAADAGGKIAGDARRKLEMETGTPVVSRSNFLPVPKELPNG